MNLSEIEKKLLMLALDRAATDHEIGAAAKKFIESMRSRYPSGVELIKAIQGEQRIAVTPSYNVDPYANEAWRDILRTAQKMGAQYAAAQQQQRQQTWAQYCAAHGNPFQPKPKTAEGIFEKVRKKFRP